MNPNLIPLMDGNFCQWKSLRESGNFMLTMIIIGKWVTWIGTKKGSAGCSRARLKVRPRTRTQSRKERPRFLRALSLHFPCVQYLADFETGLLSENAMFLCIFPTVLHFDKQTLVSQT